MSKRKARAHDIVCKDEHLTKTDHGGTADINFIAQQYMQGKLPWPSDHQGVFADVSNLNATRAMEIVAELKSTFAGYPSVVRDHFSNDPLAYSEWATENAELIEVHDRGLTGALYDEIYGIEPDSFTTRETPESAESAQNGAESPENTTTEGES